MPHLLHLWDTLITTTLNSSSANLASISDEAIQMFMNQSEAEEERVKNLLQ